jgi:transketolase
VEESIASLESAISVQGRPSVIIARTLKGKGVSFMEDQEGWHGKPVPAGELEKALQEIGEDSELEEPFELTPPNGNGDGSFQAAQDGTLEAPQYSKGEKVATRQAYGAALAKLGAANPAVVALDGDTKNSTYSNKFLAEYPDRFVECFIAEQNMVGAAVGLGAMGKIPFASTFACFLSRAYDQIRMAAISQANMKLCGSHAGISIGQDGPSQMALEDLAMMRAIAGSTVFYPSDAVCAERLVALAAQTPGIVYIRSSRPKTPILYSNDEDFQVGGSKVLKSSDKDRATLVAAGVTLHEALKASLELESQGLAVRVIDLYSIKPIDEETLLKAARETQLLITVEDHYSDGGLGDAVLGALASQPCRLHKIAVEGLPRSGESAQLMDAFGLSAKSIVKKVKELVR